MKPKNFYDYLENIDIFAENVLTYCEEFLELQVISLDYLENGKEKNKKQLEASMIIFGVNTKDGLAAKKKIEAYRVSEVIENITKFINFMKKEDKSYNDLMKSDEYLKWVDSDSLEGFFEPIKSLPVYINKYAGVKVIDLLEAFAQIMGLMVVDIEELTGVPFPVKSTLPQIMAVQYEMSKKGVKLKDKEVQELAHLILTYEDFEYLITFIKEEVEKLEEPVRL